MEIHGQAPPNDLLSGSLRVECNCRCNCAGSSSKGAVVMSRLGKFVAIGLLLAAGAVKPVLAADMPGDFYLRGSQPSEPSEWTGAYAGAYVGYSRLNSDFSSSIPSIALSGGASATDTSVGGFIGYNTQYWDPQLVLGLEFGYNRPLSLESSSSGTDGVVPAAATYRLIDYATARARLGYKVGQFLPYAVLGGAVGHVEYSTAIGASYQSQEVFPLGFVAGLGVDVLLLPNLFLRGEWEYTYFAPVGEIGSNINSARVGLGVRF
jgi:outer membrane immunogenic protein